MTSPNTLSAAVTNAVLYQLMNIHTAFPAKVISYDFTTRKASLQPQIDKKYTDGTTQVMPVLNNVPVVMPSASGFEMNFPVNAGDYCLVICCERAIDRWLTTAQQAPPEDPRKLDLSDAVAIIGLNPFTLNSGAENNDDFALSYQGSSIKIKKNGDVIINTSNKVAIGTSLVEVLDVISQTLNLLATSVTSATGAPFTFTANWLSLQVQIDSIKGAI